MELNDFAGNQFTVGSLVVWPYQKGHWQCLVFGYVLEMSVLGRIQVQPLVTSRTHPWAKTPDYGSKPVWVLTDNVVRVK